VFWSPLGGKYFILIFVYWQLCEYGRMLLDIMWKTGGNRTKT